MRSHDSVCRRDAAPTGCRGFTLVEIVVAVSLLAVLFSLTGGLIVRVRKADRITAERQAALAVVENLMERAAALAKSGGDVRELTLTSDESMLLNSRLAMDVGATDVAGMSPVTIQITWTNAAGQETAPVSLTAWLPNTTDDGSGAEVKP